MAGLHYLVTPGNVQSARKQTNKQNKHISQRTNKIWLIHLFRVIVLVKIFLPVHRSQLRPSLSHKMPHVRLITGLACFLSTNGMLLLAFFRTPLKSKEVVSNQVLLALVLWTELTSHVQLNLGKYPNNLLPQGAQYTIFFVHIPLQEKINKHLILYNFK